jgi:hypothetical protein
MSDKTLVYQLDVVDSADRDEIARPMLTAFLKAHGIDPKLFLIGNSISVYRHEDGSFWLETWKAFDGYPLCETCPSCVRQEKVVAVLAAPVPAVIGSMVFPDSGDLPVVQAPDRLAAAESAYRAELEVQAGVVRRSSGIVQMRGEQLQALKSEVQA